MYLHTSAVLAVHVVRFTCYISNVAGMCWLIVYLSSFIQICIFLIQEYVYEMYTYTYKQTKLLGLYLYTLAMQ